MIIQTNYPLKNLNTFGIPAVARKFIEILRKEDIQKLLNEIDLMNEKFIILGGGSNILFTGDFEGLVIKISTKGIEILEEGENDILISAEAGENWNDVVDFCVERGYYGAENLAGIPGTIGAAPVQNIGAYGAELKDIFHNLEGFSIEKSETKTFTADECRFGYRESIFKRELKNDFLITRVVLRLKKRAELNLNYRAFNDYIKSSGRELNNPADVRKAVLEIRGSKLPDPSHLGNAGSFFKNPEIDGEHLLQLKDKYHDLVYFETGDGKYKIPAGWLIEKSGFKGKRSGNTGTFEKQALIIVNHGEASGNEILRFANSIRKVVKDKFRIELLPEVNIL